MTAGYRITARRATRYGDVRPHAKTLLKAAPKRALWGPDWPHVKCRIEIADDGVMLSEIQDWIANDGSLRQSVFVDNPAQLCGFAGPST